MKAVLDTNIWLDWLVFRDPGLAPLRAAFEAGRIEIFIDEACEAELARVLGYSLQKKILAAGEQSACMAECRGIARRIAPAAAQRAHTALAALPKCRDAADQKFLEAAAAAGADLLVTKDAALLELARRDVKFRIIKPDSFSF